MEFTEILGYVGALFVGVVLGLIGGGGSILTVPVMVYLFALNPVVATGYSLFVVGTTALFGAFRNMKKKMVDFKTAFIFATPAFIAVFLTRRYLLPAIPENLFTIGNFEFTKSIVIMLFFAIVMLAASLTMIRNKRPEPNVDAKINYNYPLIMIQGIFLGFITGAVGAGGGFLIIPALVLLAKLPMKKAVATSLLIIAVNSLIGFTGDIATLEIDWQFLLIFTAISIVGIFIGIKLGTLINGKKLKKGFGWFVLLMGIYIIYKEISS
ncbi:sulfite exporter TauE/SafE family protein [Aequorivita sp. F47161]|uniref:Probable membrane transporter protein n=1 Tax=Aequorivita vitellina TaxID=2874475 RepID=A0A9X1QXS7_9FLAO|nr:sulfite exporter TauE/SafE family protein [Aequorivita vitellina]MCG2419821.1 sulfite exporter TauE/SafE family protein [Aequorivita vitellina]